MDNVIGVSNPYGLVQEAGKRTYRKKHTMRRKPRKTRKTRKTRKFRK